MKDWVERRTAITPEVLQDVLFLAVRVPAELPEEEVETSIEQFENGAKEFSDLAHSMRSGVWRKSDSFVAQRKSQPYSSRVEE